MRIIDISSWQSNDDGSSAVDWQGLIDAGIEGVIIKIGEGDTLDEGFVAHVNAAVENGMKYGVYYYANAANEGEAVEEALRVDEWITEYLRSENPELGIWYDAEDGNMTGGDVTATCAAFLTAMSNSGYNYVGIYSSWNWLSAEGVHFIRLDELDYTPIWVAQYSPVNDLVDEYPQADIRIWQYTDHLSDALPYDADVYYE